MSLLGIQLTLLIGESVPVPAPPTLMEALVKVEITHSDDARSGFQITFQAGRSGKADFLDYPLLSSPLLKPCNRVILIVTFNAIPRVLMDGIITNQQLTPGSEPGRSTLTITGEDVSLMMDMEEKSVEHPAQDETIVALKIIASYAKYGLIPNVRPPLAIDPPIPIERVPVQQSTDLEYLKAMAQRYAYVFYITPGPVPFTNTAYWGPPNRLDVPQPALTVDMGPETNVDSINFQNNSLSLTQVSGSVQDRLTNQSMPVQNILTTQLPLSSQPAILTQSCVRKRRYRAEAGLNVVQAMARAQAVTDASVNTVTAQGELDALRYGGLLRARGIVGLRGAGYSYDGLYYVKKVTHVILKGSYKQKFTLTREGLGSITPAVRT
jgi:hypothetical protein